MLPVSIPVPRISRTLQPVLISAPLAIAPAYADPNPWRAAIT